MAPTKNVAADANDGSEANMGIGSTREGTNTSLEVSIISGVSGVSVMPGLGGPRCGIEHHIFILLSIDFAIILRQPTTAFKNNSEEHQPPTPRLL